MGTRSALAIGVLAWLYAGVPLAHAQAEPGEDEQPPPAQSEEQAPPAQSGPAQAAQALAADSVAVAAEEAALEFRTNVPWTRLVLSGRQTIAGRSPLRVPGPLLGNFWLEAHGPGVELQRGRVRFSLDDTGSRVFSYGGVSFRENFARGVLYPGLSQLRTRQPVKGAILTGLGTAGIGLSIWAQHDLRSAEDSERSVEAAIAAGDTVAAQSGALYDARADREHLKARRDLMLKATGIVWGVSLIDAIAFTPPFRVRDVDETSLTLSLSARSRGAAAVRSLVFPGLGQEYNGDRAKAAWVASAALGAVSYLVWRQDHLERARADLSAAESRGPGPENDVLRDNAARDVDDAKKDRDVALWITAGTWGVSLLDTILSFQEPWGTIPVESTSTGAVGWVADPIRGELAARVRF